MVSKSQVSRLCAELDAEVERFRQRRLDGPYPYVWLDATFIKVRSEGRVVSMAIVIAIGVRASGEREVLGLDLGPSEDGAEAQQFLRGLLARGLSGVRLVIGDAHQGLKGAIRAVLQGASYQRCRAHFMRNALAHVSKSAAEMVAATIRTVFVQPEAASAREQWLRVAESFREGFPRLTQLLEGAEEEVLAYLAFPREHWRQIWSNNPLERPTRRSSGGRRWSASFRTRGLSFGWSVPSWPSSTTSGKSAGATSAPNRWPSWAAGMGARESRPSRSRRGKKRAVKC